MGPLRHRQLIRWLSIVVAFNIVAGLVALYAHSGDASGRETRARVAEGSTSSSTSGGVLAGGHFSKRRGSSTTATSGGSGPSAPAATRGAQPTSPTTGAAAGLATPTSGAPAPTTRPSPGSTASTGATTATSRPTTAASGPSTAASGGGSQPGVVVDPGGDTFVDGTQDPITESRADIVRAGAAYGPGGITFTMQVQTPNDPRQDQKWGGDSTYALWAVDTTGDAKPDFEIQYYYDAGSFGGSVDRPGDAAGPSVCDVSAATYGPDGYSVTVDPACLGNPATLSYRATIFYDTNPKDDNADVASDIAPNGGMSFPVARPKP